MQNLLVCFLLGVVYLLATPLDDYVWKHDENYKWVELPEYAFTGSSVGRNYNGKIYSSKHIHILFQYEV